MHGKVIQFKADIDNFKVKNGTVTVNLTADTKDIVLDQLSDIYQGSVMVNFEASQTELLPEEAENANS
ncbi:hypothetical protein BHU41_06480 [Lactobacillus crispatus]|uniref:Uncharacterized protein n=1 Tax=Lactobacillus crispatus TaxID=47770 RepID=A0A2M9WPJ3_9LACO|nr:hypothetical protein [Lactobacillus crispatus]PJZ17354.1 hypothetical protein BHU41_06480 [Lactobacillus crispatus]